MQISARHVGGIRFLKVGRLCVSFCVTRQARPLSGSRPIRLPIAAFAAGALMALARWPGVVERRTARGYRVRYECGGLYLTAAFAAGEVHAIS